MRKTISILLYLAIAFGCVQPCVAAQKPGRKSISAEEKKELEKRFQGLNTFYIDDDGTVVYYQKNEPAVNNSDAASEPAKKTSVAVPHVRTKIKVYINESGEYVVSKEETANEPYDGQGIPTEGGASAPEQNKTAKVGNTSINNVQDAAQPVPPLNETTAIQKPKPSKKNAPTQMASTFKSLEMAMADVDQLLEELKKQQPQRGGAKGKIPLSQRASSGVDGSLRGQTYELSEYEEPKEEIVVVEESDMDGDPTYYINGVVATKKEVNKLRSGDILKKVIKTSKTNPRGEWWIETRKK